MWPGFECSLNFTLAIHRLHLHLGLATFARFCVLTPRFARPQRATQENLLAFGPRNVQRKFGPISFNKRNVQRKSIFSSTFFAFFAFYSTLSNSLEYQRWERRKRGGYLTKTLDWRSAASVPDFLLSLFSSPLSSLSLSLTLSLLLVSPDVAFLVLAWDSDAWSTLYSPSSRQPSFLLPRWHGCSWFCRYFTEFKPRSDDLVSVSTIFCLVSSNQCTRCWGLTRYSLKGLRKVIISSVARLAVRQVTRSSTSLFVFILAIYLSFEGEKNDRDKEREKRER